MSWHPGQPQLPRYPPREHPSSQLGSRAWVMMIFMYDRHNIIRCKSTTAHHHMGGQRPSVHCVAFLERMRNAPTVHPSCLSQHPAIHASQPKILCWKRFFTEQSRQSQEVNHQHLTTFVQPCTTWNQIVPLKSIKLAEAIKPAQRENGARISPLRARQGFSCRRFDLTFLICS